eukprot:1966968-Prymnesium_polylepis.1
MLKDNASDTSLARRMVPPRGRWLAPCKQQAPTQWVTSTRPGAPMLHAQSQVFMCTRRVPAAPSSASRLAGSSQLALVTGAP